MTDAERIAGALSEAQKRRLVTSQWEPRQMGGFGVAFHEPALARKVGINHPVFGSHYELNELGLEVRTLLTEGEGK